MVTMCLCKLVGKMDFDEHPFRSEHTGIIDFYHHNFITSFNKHFELKIDHFVQHMEKLIPRKKATRSVGDLTV